RPLRGLVPVGFRTVVRLSSRRAVRFRLMRPVGANSVAPRTRCWRRNCDAIYWSGVWRSRWLRAHNCPVAECPGPGCRRDRRRAMVLGCPLLWVDASCLLMLCLSGDRRNMPFMGRRFLLGRGTRDDSAIAAVVADTVHGSGVIDDRRVVNVANGRHIYIAGRAVVVELSVLPASALIAFTVVAVTTTDTAIEAYLLAPVALMEGITVAAPAPISGSPEQARLRSHNPCARNPIVAVIIAGVSPISGSPDVARSGEQRLLIGGQFRRSE